MRRHALLLGLFTVILLGLAVTLVIATRSRSASSDAPVVAASSSAPPPTAVRPPPQLLSASPKRPDAALAPPAQKGEKLVHGELPFPPPVFTDERDRDRFRRWWVVEMVRRADVCRRLDPDRRYPSDQETERMMERLYDLVEPPPEHPDRTVMAQAADRQLQYFQLANKDFVAAFGMPATEIVRRGGDPKWGTASDPPVLPPNWQGP